MDYYGLYGHGWIGNIKTVLNNFSLSPFRRCEPFVLLAPGYLDGGGWVYYIPSRGFLYPHLPISQPYIPPPFPHLLSTIRSSSYLQNHAPLSALPSISYMEYLYYPTCVVASIRRVAATILDKPYEGKQQGGEENSMSANEAPF